MMYNPVQPFTSMTESPKSNTYPSYLDLVNIPPTIGNFPPNNELKDIVNLWKA